MKTRILLAMAITLLVGVGPGIVCSAHGDGIDGTGLVALRDAPEVELYITSWCPYCKKAARFFRSRGIPFVEYDIERDRNAARRKKELDQQNGVPFAIINGQKIHGFSEESYLRALNLKK